MNPIKITLLYLAFSATALANQHETLTWYQYNLPPYHILKGKYAGQGPLDKMFEVWKKTLPDHEHRSIVVNITRMSREFRSKRDHRCITGSFVFPESRDHWIWSEPIYVEPPAVIVTRPEVWEKWGRPRSMDFAELLANPDFKFGHFDRIYGGLIDRQIAASKGRSNLITVASHASGETLMKMLHRGRVDYILEYLPEIRWLSLSKQLDYAEDSVTVLIDKHSSLSPVHVGCVNTPWGRKLIERLNTAINADMRKQVWKHYQRWLSNPDTNRYFEDIQSKYFTSAD